MPDDEARRAAQVEWLVKCAEQAVTRWEGAYELAPAGDFMSRYDRAPTRDLADRLTHEQRERLRAALLGASEFERGEQCLEELFRDDADPRLRAWLVAELREHYPEVEKQSYGVARALIQRIARRDGRFEVQRLALEFEELKSFDRDGGDGQGRLRVCRRLLELY